MEAQKQVEDRAAPLQTNRSHLTDEERHENNRRSKYNWYLNHKDYFKPGRSWLCKYHEENPLPWRARGIRKQT